ncbi:cache domain-containing protein [Desulfonema limicola]|nr:cache domain-containing protein [Desulfonema limicola]
MKNKYFNIIKNLPIRFKFLLSYCAIFIIAISFGSLITYALFYNTIEAHIESELKNTTATILNMVKTSANVSIKNHLRAVAEKNKEIAAFYYSQYEKGIISEHEAKKRASEVLLCQTIGKTGYIYCLDSKGICVLHPQEAVVGVDYSDRAFVQEQKSKKYGYIEYDWKNPGEDHFRPKAVYMSYFEPWDWIISVSSYREDFINLVNVEDFRDSILSVRFGKTGYSFVIDPQGNLIIHPKTEGVNYYHTADAQGRHFVQEVCRRKNGKIIYSWKNPGEDKYREKIAIFNFIPEFNWIVESSGYTDEFYAPLKIMKRLIIAGALITLMLVLPITFSLSAAITNPLKKLMKLFETGITGDFTVRAKKSSDDEVGQLAAYFNLFMQRLETYSRDLENAVKMHKKTTEALRLSEEMFSKAFRSSPNGIIITTLKDGRFINVNNGFLNATGYSRMEITGKTFQELRILPYQDERLDILDMLEHQGRLGKHEIVFKTKSGELRLGIISAEIIEIWDEPCMLSNIVDVTESRRLEKEIMDISDRERRKIGQNLHDDLCPHLIGIEGFVRVMKKKLDIISPEKAKKAETVQKLIQEAIDKARRLARGLCPVYLVEHGLESSLTELAENIEKVFGISCKFKSKGQVKFQDNIIATHVFYIAQEAANNAARHSRAGEIMIEISENINKINMRIIDNGTGLPESTTSRGMGLNIMKYRAKMIGGILEIKSGPDRGTCIHLALKNDMIPEIFV